MRQRGTLRRIDASGIRGFATFDGSGTRLIISILELMRPAGGTIYVTPVDRLKLKALKPFGLLRSPSPTGSILALIAIETPLSTLIPVRLVAHHMRLLGLLKTSEAMDTLVLVDYDATK